MNRNDDNDVKQQHLRPRQFFCHRYWAMLIVVTLVTLCAMPVEKGLVLNAQPMETEIITRRNSTANETNTAKTTTIAENELVLKLQKLSDTLLGNDCRWVYVESNSTNSSSGTPPNNNHWAWRDGNGTLWSSARIRDSWYATTSKNKNCSLALYGSSHVRELFLELQRLHFGITTRNSCHGVRWDPRTPECRTSEEWAVLASRPEHAVVDGSDCLPWHLFFALGSMSRCGRQHEQQLLAQAQNSSTTTNNFRCTAGWPPQREGLDLETCGPPGFRHAVELWPLQAAIGFKTMIHTPPLEQLFLQRLTSVGMRRPDLVVVEMGWPWGPRGNRSLEHFPNNMTLEEEISYFVGWVRETAFKDTIVVWVAACDCSYNPIPSTGTEQARRMIEANYSDRAVVLDKRHLCQTKPPQVPGGHGCAGPVLNVLAQLLHQVVDEYLFYRANR